MGDRAERPARASPALDLAEAVIAVASRLAGALAGLACLGALAVICYAVAMRYFVGRPLTWADEVAGYLVVLTVMLGVAEAQRRGENIGVDIVNDRSPRWLIGLVGVVSAAAVAAVAWLFVDEGLKMVAFSRMIGIMSNVLPGLPMWTVQIAVPIGGLLLLLVALVQLWAWAAGRRPAGIDAKAAPARGAHE